MKTVVTIPWNAVIQGGPPSDAKAPLLPLVVAQSCGSQSDATLPQIEEALRNPMAMISRSATSSLIELPLRDEGSVAILTSDGQTAVVLQAAETSLASRLLDQPEHRRDAFARTYVARYARLDPDARAFVPADTTGEDEPAPSPRFEFLRPASWGFTETNNRMHWTAHNLFRSPSARKSSPKPTSATRPRFEEFFEETAPADRGDPFQCIPQLRQFRTLCDQSESAPSAASAYALALSLGRCRLFGVKLTDNEDFTLAPSFFNHASLYLIDHLKDVIDWLKELQMRPDSYRGYAQRNVALELLEIRMDAQAAYLALDEAYAAARSTAETKADAMGRRLNQVRRMIDLFDGNLQKQIPLLRLAASTRLLENWRRLLAPAHRTLPPWWLDGCLEDALA
jgi:hypothetical protein